MSDVKIATRESYGNALAELGKVNPDVVVFDADLAGATKTGVFKKHSLKDILTVVSLNPTWLVWQLVSLQQVKSHLYLPSLCS